MPGNTKGQSVVQFEYKGILPPPKFLQQYNKEIPDGGDRLMKLVENQSQHRREIESKFISSNIVLEWAGLILGFLSLIAFLAASVYLVVNGYETTGTILGTVDILSIVGLFVYGSKKKRT